MAYSADVAKLLTDRLTKLTTLNRHQLAGQGANLDFWLSEVEHALAIIDGHPARFARMRRAQTGHAREFQSHELDSKLLKRVPDAEFRDARQALSQATVRFLARCATEGLVDESTAHRESERLGIGADSP